MIRCLIMLTLVGGLLGTSDAREPAATAGKQERQALKTTPDPLPEGIQNFNGMIIGRLAKKDVERGTFVAVVDAVPRVWRNSKAKTPKSIVGKSVAVSGVSGKFLDVLVVMRPGETIEFECQHDGKGLVFPGELLRKVAPYKPEDYPELPESFRGFRGVVQAEVKKKDPETFELIIKVKDVVDTWEDNSAEKPKSIVGKSMMLAGFWNRREMYHGLQVGDQIEVGMQHISRQGDHLNVAKFVRKAKPEE